MTPTETDMDDLIGTVRAELKRLRWFAGVLQLTEESLRAIETADAQLRCIRWELRDLAGSKQYLGD